MGRQPRPLLTDGVFRGSDAIAEGALTTRALRDGRVRRLYQDVYLPSGAPADHLTRCQAAALVAPPTAVLTGRSAAVVHGVPLAGPLDPVEFAIPETARFSSHHGPLSVRRTLVAPGDSEPWHGIRLATPLRTAVDLASRASLADAVADLDVATRAGLAHLDVLRTRLTVERFKGVVRARRAAELADPRAESPQESRLRVLLVLDGLNPTPQYQIWRDGMMVARVDLAFIESRVAVEYDGRWHGDDAQLPRDRDRINRIQAAGWRIVFVTAGPLRTDPRAVVQSVRAALLTHP